MRSLFLLSMMTLPLWSENAGRATAELLVASETVKAGATIPAALRMKFEDGWHGYWSNPGETGMAAEIEWQLPDGWKAGPLLYPVPKFHMAGELASYVYEGEVLIPFELTAPATVTEPQVLKGTVSWLACDEKSCVAGDAELQVTLAAGSGDAGAHAELIAKAKAALPETVEGVTLQVTEQDGMMQLLLQSEIDLVGAEVFPVNQRVLDQTKRILLEKSASGYAASVRKNEFAPARIDGLSLVIVPKQPRRAISVEWKK